MKTIAILIGTLLVLTVVAVAMGAPPPDAGSTSNRYQVVTDLNQTQMLGSHQPMMEQMRPGATPQMTDRMPQDPMWQTLDASMVDLMEQNQAQIDRMLARR